MLLWRNQPVNLRKSIRDDQHQELCVLDNQGRVSALNPDKINAPYSAGVTIGVAHTRPNFYWSSDV